MARRAPLLWLWLILFAAPLLTGCLRRQAAQAPLFLPPTPPATVPGLPPTPTPTANLPSPTPPCTNSLVYLEDLTIPDGTEVQPGETLDKQWRVRNAGTCPWDERYRLRFVEGDLMGAPEELPLFPARPGAEAVLRILFTAPAAPGDYTSLWQAVDPQGHPFGDPVFIQIVVVTPTESPSP